MKRCKNCRYWMQGHDGMVEENKYGHCNFFNCLHYNDPENEYNTIIGLCEGCVDVKHKVEDFEFVTGIDFGCINWKKK